MIYVNDKQVDLKDSKSQAGKEFNAALKYFNEVGWPLRFKVKPSILHRDENIDGQVFMRMPYHYIHHTATIYTDFGTERWRYTPLAPYERNGTLQWPTENRGAAYDKKRISFNRDQADLAFFLWYKCKPFKAIYSIDDARTQAANKVQAKMDAMKLDSAFYSEYSILQKDKVKLRTVARAYNVPGVQVMDDNQVLVALDKVIRDLVKEGKLTVDDFMESLQIDVLTELSARIYKAEEDNLITHNSQSGTWYYVGEGGRVGDKIVQVPISKKDDRYNHLRDYLVADHRALKKFEEHAGKDPNKGIDIDVDKLEELPWHEVMTFIDSVGIAKPGRDRKKADVFKDIREMFETQRQ
jgi:hypothetical protein